MRPGSITTQPSTPILVLGDWIVDENWVLAPHESRLASLEGREHFRAVGDHCTKVRNLCGAGLAARLLFWHGRFDRWCQPMETWDGLRFDVYGLGNWAEADEEILMQMCHPRPLQGLNPFTLRCAPEDNENRIHELQGLVLRRLPRYGDPPEGELGTTRVFRLYRYAKGRLELDSRIDFEARLTSVSPKERNDTFEEAVSRVLERREEQEDAYSPSPTSPDGGQAVQPFPYAVVDDADKGGLSEALLRNLRTKGLVDPNTRWFVKTKKHPNWWLSTWCREWGRLRLWLLHPKSLLAQDLTGTAREATIRKPAFWFVGGRQPSAEAVDLLDRLLRLGHAKGLLAEDRSLVLCVPSDLACLAVSRHPGAHGAYEQQGYYLSKGELNPLEEQIAGRQTTVFATLTRELIRADLAHRNDKSDGSVARCIEAALQLGSRYLAARASDLQELAEDGEHSKCGGQKQDGGAEPEDLKFDPSPSPILPEAPATEYRPAAFPWTRCKEEWERAFKSPGLTTGGRNDEPRLQIWRAMDQLPGYVETVDQRRSEIARLRSELEELKEGARKRQEHAGALLLAGPGSGKTFLAKKLAESLSMPLKSFNIVQLVTRENVLRCFDSIASAQAGQPDQLHLVVFDEINAKLEGSPVYDLFLSVLDNGTYNWHGRPYKLQPCAWLFIGTETPESEGSDKAPDFLSRLALGEFRLDIPFADLEGEDDSSATEQEERKNALRDQVRLGFVYRGAHLLQKKHPDVQRISAEVLRAFHSLPFGTSVRKLKHLCSGFSDIHYGEVRRCNMPRKLHQALASAPAGPWTDLFKKKGANAPVDLDRRLILIESEPRPC